MKEEPLTQARLQATIWLHQALCPRLPLPPMTGWSACPEFAAELAALVLSRGPKRILEVGSGVSTLITAYALERNKGEWQLISLDQDIDYADRTRETLARHRLATRTNVWHAPLVKYSLQGTSWEWYDLSKVPLPEDIELLIIDGPPNSTQPLARYPAMPLLLDRLSANAVIILDDANRASERGVVTRWLMEYPELEHTYLHTAKGTSIFRRT